MSGAIPPLPQYDLMAWCSVTAHGQLYLYLCLSQPPDNSHWQSLSQSASLKHHTPTTFGCCLVSLRMWSIWFLFSHQLKSKFVHECYDLASLYSWESSCLMWPFCFCNPTIITNFIQTFIPDCWFENIFCPYFALKCPDKIFVPYLGNWSNTRSSSP